jgi:hypothetical protein
MVVATKPKTKEQLHTPAMLLFTFYKNNTFTYVSNFAETYYCVSFQTLNCRSRLKSSRLRHFIISDREKLGRWGYIVGEVSNGITFTQSLVKIC